MNYELFDAHWATMNHLARYRLKDLARYPTESNAAYVTGYFAALSDQGVISIDTHNYLLAVVGKVEAKDDSYINHILALWRSEI